MSMTEEKKMVIPIQFQLELNKLYKKRFNSNKLRCRKLKIHTANIEDFKTIIYQSFVNGFICYYCGKKMNIKSKYPYKEAPSIDHMVPISRGGTNNINNLIVCCHACNIIKGTLSSNTFIDLLNKIKDDTNLMNKIFNESFNGKFANKLERVKEENINGENLC
jgi:5-methylcytosine-specific restriction endonuclease McrA